MLDATTTPPGSALRRADLALLGALALALRIPAFLAGRHLTFDDGVFASSVVAMRHGGLPFRDVFSSQGPLFLPLVWLGDLLGGRTLDAPRVVPVLSGVAVTVITASLAARWTDRRGGLLAGALAATSGCLAWVTGPIAADGPALAFAVGALWLATWLRDRPSTGRAALVGLAVGATLSTKAIEAHVLVPVGLVLGAPLLAGVRRRRIDTGALVRLATAGAVAVGVFVALALPFGWSDVWDQSFRYRTEAATGSAPVANTGKILSTLWDRDLVLLAVLCAVLVVAVLARRGLLPGSFGPDDRPAPASALPLRDPAWTPSNRVLGASWAVATYLWLAVAVSPMWRAHVSAVVLPLALVAALWRPPVRVLTALAVVAVPLGALQLHELVLPSGYQGRDRQIVATLRALPAGAWAIPDDPGWAWRAGRRTTDDLVDTSMLRVQQGRYTSASLARQAADPHVCAVVISSRQRFGAFPDLPDRLEEEGYVLTDTWGPASSLWLRADCRPPAG